MRTATAADLPAIRTVLAEAYAADPLMRWIFPDEKERLDCSAAWLGLFVEQYVSVARVDVIDDPDLVAVAVWRMPGDPAPASEALPTISGLLTALIGGVRAGEVATGLHAISSVTPPPPFVYLQFLAVRPDRQRRGLGATLLKAGLAEADRRSLSVHLETTNRDNLAFYEAHGFAISSSLLLPPNGPELWGMYRDPS